MDFVSILGIFHILPEIFRPFSVLSQKRSSDAFKQMGKLKVDQYKHIYSFLSSPRFDQKCRKNQNFLMCSHSATTSDIHQQIA